MKKNLVVVVAGLVILVVAATFLVGPRVLRKVRTTLGNQSTASTTSLQTGKYNPPTETVSGSISLNIASPLNGSTTTSSSVDVSGKTTANADVFVNDQETTADVNGNFKITLTLDEGENTITVSANDSDGNYIEKDITVTYELPAQ